MFLPAESRWCSGRCSAAKAPRGLTRVLEYLVVRQGFTVFAIEANQPECRAINDYVLHGTGDATTALRGIYLWTWNTEEMLAMIEWMRAWNADPRHAHKVQFLGFDMQTS
jgi:erythromycin esterase